MYRLRIGAGTWSFLFQQEPDAAKKAVCGFLLFKFIGEDLDGSIFGGEGENAEASEK
jgi:hypothetical protein